ncbi:MAG: metal-dependent hydrolase [archaeon]
MKAKYLGHSGFIIDDLVIHPFISGNPTSNIELEDINCKIVCITHDHQDHLGDAFEIARKNGAIIVAIHEIAELAASKGLDSEGMNLGGEIVVGAWKIKMVPSFHSANLGVAAGFILKKEKTIYHAGDTGLFSDMKLIGEENIDVAILPIGDRYTLGIKDAIRAVEFISPKKVVPIHYGTFPVINSNPEEFSKKCPVKVEIFKIGEEKEI